MFPDEIRTMPISRHPTKSFDGRPFPLTYRHPCIDNVPRGTLRRFASSLGQNNRDRLIVRLDRHAQRLALLKSILRHRKAYDDRAMSFAPGRNLDFR